MKFREFKRVCEKILPVRVQYHEKNQTVSIELSVTSKAHVSVESLEPEIARSLIENLVRTIYKEASDKLGEVSGYAPKSVCENMKYEDLSCAIPNNPHGKEVFDEVTKRIKREYE